MRTTILGVVAGVLVLGAACGAATAAPSGDGDGQQAKSTHRHAGKHHKSASKPSKARHTKHAHKHATAG